MRFGKARCQSRAKDLEFVGLPGEPEFDTVPVQARCALAMTFGNGRNAQPPNMLGHLGKVVVRKHRDMAEQVVKAVRGLKIVELVASSDEITDRKDPLAQH